MQTRTVKKMLREARKDETAGSKFYKKLANKLEEKGEKKMVRNIAKQERKHKQKIISLLKDVSEKD